MVTSGRSKPVYSLSNRSIIVSSVGNRPKDHGYRGQNLWIDGEVRFLIERCIRHFL